MVCAECMKMCCLGGKNSVVKGLKGTGAGGPRTPKMAMLKTPMKADSQCP